MGNTFFLATTNDEESATIPHDDDAVSNRVPRPLPKNRFSIVYIIDMTDSYFYR